MPGLGARVRCWDLFQVCWGAMRELEHGGTDGVPCGCQLQEGAVWGWEGGRDSIHVGETRKGALKVDLADGLEVEGEGKRDSIMV